MKDVQKELPMDPSQIARDFIKTKEKPVVTHEVSQTESDLIDKVIKVEQEKKANAIKEKSEQLAKTEVLPKQSALPVVVKIDTEGTIAFEDQNQLASAASLLIKMRVPPVSLINEGREAVMAAMLLCKQHNLPVSAMNEMAYVKGKIAAYGSLMTALVERHPKYGEQNVFFVDEAGEKICSDNKNLKNPAWACVIKSKKKGSTEWNEFYFSIDDAQQAGLLTKMTKPDSGWIKYTKDLLYNKAKNRCYRTQYASAIYGVESVEDLQYRDVKEDSALEELNKKLGLTDEQSN